MHFLLIRSDNPPKYRVQPNRSSQCKQKVHIIFQSDRRGLAGSTQSKQWRIELLYRYKRAMTSRNNSV